MFKMHNNLVSSCLKDITLAFYSSLAITTLENFQTIICLDEDLKLSSSHDFLYSKLNKQGINAREATSFTLFGRRNYRVLGNITKSPR